MASDHMSEEDKRHKHNTKLQAGADFKVPADRGCTDVLFLLLILASWGLLTLLGLVFLGQIENQHFPAGDPQRLLAPIDSEGRLCGLDAAVIDRPKGYYLPSASFVCIDECPQATDASIFYCSGDDANYKRSISASSVGPMISNNTCMFQIKTKTVLSYCVPFDADYQDEFMAAYGQTFNGTMGGNPTNYVTQLVTDFLTAKSIILGFGIGVAALLGFIYLILLQIPGILCLLVWAILFAILGCWVGLGLFTIYTANEWTVEDPKVHRHVDILAVRYAGYSCYGVAGLWLVLLIFLRKRISLAINVIKEASRAVGAMKALIFYPIIQCIGLAIFLVPWIFYSVYLMSSGTFELREGSYKGYTFTYKDFEYTDNQRYAMVYFLFSYFWTSEFIIALGQIVVAMAIATWYFTRDKSTIGTSTVISSVFKASFYHAGTAAFGSLIIAIIKTIRAVIAYFQKKAARSKNKVLQMVLCCLQCCLWCFEKCMKFLNKNAYIQTAIFGYSFCTSCKKAFFLILRNILRVAAVSLVGDFILLLGKLLIPVATTFGAYVVIQFTIAEELNGIVGPLVIIAILALFTANLFNEVYGMAISTILQCFLADEELFAPEDRYAEGSLTETIAHINSKAGRRNSAISPIQEEGPRKVELI